MHCIRRSICPLLPLLFLKLTAAFPSPSSAPVILPNPLTASGNVSEAGEANAIDPRFSLEYEIRERSLIPEGSCYINTIMTLVTLGEEDFLGLMELSRFSYQPFTDVALTISPSLTGEGTLERRFAVWSLFQAISTSARLGVFAEATFTMRWEGNRVGYLSYRKSSIDRNLSSSYTLEAGNVTDSTIDGNVPAARAVSKADGQPPVLDLSNTNSPSITLVDDSTILMDASNDPRLKVKILFGEQDVIMADAFIGITGAIQEIASFDSRERTQRFTLSPRAWNVFLKVSEYADQHRLSPPFLNYAMTAKSLGRLARKMLREKRYKSSVMVITYDGVDVGEVAVTANIDKDVVAA